MAGLDLKDIRREDVEALVEDAKVKNKDKKDHVKTELKRQFAGLENLRVVRNGQVYNALDYLMEDIESYGSPT